ncbi:MAG: GGDEF domain-containing protein [Pseudobutyrivibrio sp.]|nr:GGDEF domain-containing protein [Pseudobutyrivibrio sp.]
MSETIPVHDSGLFLTASICIIMLLFILFMRSFDNKMRHKFAMIFTALIVMVSAVISDVYLHSIPNSDTYRIFAMIVKVICSGFVGRELVTIIDNRLTEKKKILYSLPVFITTLLVILAQLLPFNLGYAIKDGLVTGPVENVIYLQSVAYILIIMYICIEKARNESSQDAFIIMAFIVLVWTGSMLEMKGVWTNTGVGTLAQACTFIYMYMYAQRYNVDSVSKCFKRRCFYSDAAKFSKNHMAIISMDLNDLKYINDNFGHKAGDVALLTFAELVRAVKPGNYILYRTGGDEFMMLGIHSNEDEARALVGQIEGKLKDTPYSCSFGVYMYNPGDNFDEVVVKADQAMYTNKRTYKASSTKRSHAREDDNIGTELFTSKMY